LFRHASVRKTIAAWLSGVYNLLAFIC